MVTELLAIVLLAPLNARPHRRRSGGVVPNIRPIIPRKAQERLHILDSPERLKIADLLLVVRRCRNAITRNHMAQELGARAKKHTLIQPQGEPVVSKTIQKTSNASRWVSYEPRVQTVRSSRYDNTFSSAVPPAVVRPGCCHAGDVSHSAIR